MPYITIDDSNNLVWDNTLVFSGKCSEIGKAVRLYINGNQDFTYATNSSAPKCQGAEGVLGNLYCNPGFK